ncbi:MAG: NADH-quinone oxidoreductase subunit N, partial [candidate division Zixibacteria bacterium]|nr:NADH-quinone oxidoreductase subunit N [candidate division Zixibacteria bacterium]
ALLTVLISLEYARTKDIDRGEYYALILFAVSGMSMMAASVDLITFFLGLEVLSVSLYVLIGFELGELRSNEGALKYFLLGAFASGFILYGIALLYGASGGTAYTVVLQKTVTNPNPLLLGGIGMLLIGIGFKISMAPFHAWTPDVYQGAPTPVAAFMSTGSKAAGFAVLLRVFGYVFDSARADWAPLVAALAILTMAVGNLVALVQTDLKRLLAYSSIAHAGYMLLALVAGGPDGSASIMFYLLVYTLMNLAAFGVLAVLAARGEPCYTFEDIAALGKRYPPLAAVMAVAMFSLAGIPPTAGFVAKFYVFSAVIKADMFLLAIVGVLLSGVSLYYYLRVVVWMYVREQGETVSVSEGRLSPGGVVALCVSALALLVIGLSPSSLLAMAQQAVLILE